MKKPNLLVGLSTSTLSNGDHYRLARCLVVGVVVRRVGRGRCCRCWAMSCEKACFSSGVSGVESTTKSTPVGS